MKRPNFTQCTLDFQHSAIHDIYQFTGTIKGTVGAVNRSNIISYTGCLKLCGSGSETYPWRISSNTLLTWVVPIIAVLLLVPFESKQIWRCLYQITRLLGNPITQLGEVFWNISITGRCAMLVDMSVKWNEIPEDENSNFAAIRDSLYILAVMNQFKVNPNLVLGDGRRERAALNLICTAIFTDSLNLQPSHRDIGQVPSYRKWLATTHREDHHRGLVTSLISMLFFVFAGILSIQSAFEQVGVSTTAQNLALGLLSAWVPVLVLSCVVDQNPTSSHRARQHLNEFLEEVRLSLLTPGLRERYTQDTDIKSKALAWTTALSDPVFEEEPFFTESAGQGCLRWHCGVANSILAGLEDAVIVQAGRGWQGDRETVLQSLLYSDFEVGDLLVFDPRKIWHMLSALTIVFGTIAGAFLISFMTPTQGLGCRSGSYLICFVTVLLTFSLESIPWCLRISPKISTTTNTTALFIILRVVLPVLETLGMSFFLLTLLAQTFGFFHNCWCMSSAWGLGISHAYIDFSYISVAHIASITESWIAATAISTAIFVLAVLYVLLEWATQSHLSTVDYADACTRLRRTQSWKRVTFPGRWIWRLASQLFMIMVVSLMEIVISMCCFVARSRKLSSTSDSMAKQLLPPRRVRWHYRNGPAEQDGSRAFEDLMDGSSF